MANRSAAVIITIIVVLLCACPGLAFLCNGLLALVEVVTGYRVQIIGYGYNAPYWTIASLCIGILGVGIAVIVAYLVLHQKRVAPVVPPPPPDESLPPTI